MIDREKLTPNSSVRPMWRRSGPTFNPVAKSLTGVRSVAHKRTPVTSLKFPPVSLSLSLNNKNYTYNLLIIKEEKRHCCTKFSLSHEIPLDTSQTQLHSTPLLRDM